MLPVAQDAGNRAPRGRALWGVLVHRSQQPLEPQPDSPIGHRQLVTLTNTLVTLNPQRWSHCLMRDRWPLTAQELEGIQASRLGDVLDTCEGEAGLAAHEDPMWERCTPGSRLRAAPA